MGQCIVLAFQFSNFAGNLCPANTNPNQWLISSAIKVQVYRVYSLMSIIKTSSDRSCSFVGHFNSTETGSLIPQPPVQHIIIRV